MRTRAIRVGNVACGVLVTAIAVWVVAPQVIQSLGGAALRSAAQNGELETLKAWVTLGVSVDAVDDFSGRTALHHAALRGDEAMVAWLMRRGADPNLRDDQGKTPLHWAVRMDHAMVAKGLIDGGAKFRPDHPRDAALLHLASGHGDAILVFWLIEAGADVNQETSRYRRRPLHRAASSNDLQTVKLLVAKGATLGVRDGRGQTPYAIAQVGGNRDLVEFLASSR